MKTLEEKKLLVKMARMLGQPVDQALIESIEREEKLAAVLFKEQKKAEPKIPILKEDLLTEADPIPEPPKAEVSPAPPVPAFTPPVTDTVTSVMNVLKNVNTANNVYRDKELEGMRRTLAEMVQKINTLSWGGGGTGVVRIWDTDDFDRNTAGNGKVMRFANSWFYLDTLTGLESFNYGSFSDTTNQTATSANTAYEVNFNTTDASKGHYIRNNTEIVSNTTGVFNYAFSMQLTSTSASLHNAYIWIRKNNTDIPNTATIISLSDNKQYAVAAWNFFIDMNAGDHLHLMWAVDDTRVSIAAPPATAFSPAVPSVILTVNEVGK